MTYSQKLQQQLHILQPRLPLPDADAIGHSERLYQHLVSQMLYSPLPFSQFMHELLYAPGLGYYSAGATKFGAAGDFVTAPELSSLFSRSLARQCADVLTEAGGDVLEFGAGRGVMARDILLALAEQQRLPDRYLIVEVSADLQARQRETLAVLPDALRQRVQWCEQLPESFTGVVLANEVLDAVPVTRWRWRQQQLFESAVRTNADGDFEWVDIPPSAPLQQWFERLPVSMRENLPDHYWSECHLWQSGWISALAGMMQRGIVLIIDYGMSRAEYYLPERDTGTLKCYYRHHHHDNPFVMVGLQDVTAHVEYTSLAEQAMDSGFDLEGYCHQAAFLQSLGILQEAESTADRHEQLRHAQALKRLLMPHEMGESFKVMALGKGMEQSLQGFALNDQRERLG